MDPPLPHLRVRVVICALVYYEYRCVPTAEPHGDNLSLRGEYACTSIVSVLPLTIYNRIHLSIILFVFFGREARLPTWRRTNVNRDASTSIIDLSPNTNPAYILPPRTLVIQIP